MPSFHDQATSAAPPEEVWKLLYDPARFPDWWAGTGSVEVGSGGAYTMFPEGYPDFPMAQVLDTDRDGQTVKVSCLVSDLRFEWRLADAGDGGTVIDVDVEIPEAEAARLETQQDVISRSLTALATLAAA
ncbi:MAG: SRPBCC family protein [Solirubrobacteraceae bacterium]